MDHVDDHNHEVPESDLRFSSGHWRGVWIQHGYHGEMELWLKFAGGRLTGIGSDIVGDFNVTGGYNVDRGTVTFLKEYIGAHAIEYLGNAEAELPGLRGVWKLCNPTDRGLWQIWPVGSDPESNLSRHSKAGLLCQLKNPLVLLEYSLKGLPHTLAIDQAFFGG